VLILLELFHRFFLILITAIIVNATAKKTKPPSNEQPFMLLLDVDSGTAAIAAVAKALKA